MKSLLTGQFYGTTNETIHLNGITLTDTEYTHEKVDWHFHEKAYFTFIIEGKLLEGNKNEVFNCKSGSLLFHNSQEAHYNLKPKGYTRGFHIELDSKWLDSYDIKSDLISGSLNLVYPRMKWLMYNIFREMKFTAESGQPAIDALLLELLTTISGVKESACKNRPEWVDKIKEILNDATEELTLTEMAVMLNIHPVHLSRYFSRYFNCKMGDYTRTIKLQRALSLLPERDLSLTSIAMHCNFADQSHFIRAFKNQYKITPSEYRKILFRDQKC
jgi:AraC family transcriptional regulator